MNVAMWIKELISSTCVLKITTQIFKGLMTRINYQLLAIKFRKTNEHEQIWSASYKICKDCTCWYHSCSWFLSFIGLQKPTVVVHNNIPHLFLSFFWIEGRVRKQNNLHPLPGLKWISLKICSSEPTYCNPSSDLA